jgi:predicted transcriptional regulator
MKKERKSPLQIKFEILEYLYYTPRTQLRTHIWRKATGLSYDDFLKYLSNLHKKGLVEEVEGKYKLTEKGRSLYVKLKDVIPSLI